MKIKKYKISWINSEGILEEKYYDFLGIARIKKAILKSNSSNSYIIIWCDGEAIE